MGKNRQIMTVLMVALACMVGAVEILKNPQGPLAAVSPAMTVHAEKHILYGDDRGGGHLHGTGKACKSEFPADWEPEEVIEKVKRVAANDNLNWEQQQNGYYVAEEMVEGVRVRVVLNRDQKKIVTAYPTNVERNPCPRDGDKIPANDP